MAVCSIGFTTAAATGSAEDSGTTGKTIAWQAAAVVESSMKTATVATAARAEQASAGSRRITAVAAAKVTDKFAMAFTE